MQNLEIDFPITVSEFIQLAKPGAEIQGILTRFKLVEIAEKKITQISLGQLQRAEFAQVLLQDPDLFILDEPLSAQDSESSEIILNVIRELKNSGKSLILISHIGSQLAQIVDKEIFL
jgi:ABC-type Mn2+/Zn2+ transport system ATPase subunit